MFTNCGKVLSGMAAALGGGGGGSSKTEVISLLAAMLSAMRDHYDAVATTDPTAARAYALFCRTVVEALRIDGGAGVNERSLPALRLLAFAVQAT